jgi:CheY-like chemotaxis protein
MANKIFLLADDDLDDTELFCEVLIDIDKSIVCHCATDGREALKILEGLPANPDLIFLDVNMPVMNGWQCLKLLKEDERYRQIPVIIISTSSHQRERNIAASLGALGYFTKPSNFLELVQVLQLIVANVGSGLPGALQNLQGNSSQFIELCGTSNHSDESLPKY